MRKSKQSYDWLDDPFDEQKQAEEKEEIDHARKTGCLSAFLIIVILLLIGAFLFIALMFTSCSTLGSVS